MDNTLYLVTHHFPPYTQCHGKKPLKSFFNSLVEADCREASLSCLLECFPNRRSKSMLKSGEAHGNYPLGWNTNHDQWLYWSPKLHKGEYGFFHNQNNVIKNTDELAGKVVGVFGPGNTSLSLDKLQQKLANNNQQSFDIYMQPASTGSNMHKLSLNRIDAVFINLDGGEYQLRNKNINNVEYAFTVKELNYYIGFSKEKNKGKRKLLIDKFNAGINSMHTKGKIDELVNQCHLIPFKKSIR